tara:strand:- start:307 stop:471 length:165 start_codon:yes stop_codon:yes gene_type:complete
MDKIMLRGGPQHDSYQLTMSSNMHPRYPPVKQEVHPDADLLLLPSDVHRLPVLV